MPHTAARRALSQLPVWIPDAAVTGRWSRRIMEAMNIRDLLCMVNGHKWRKTEVRAGMVTEMICRRCGEILTSDDARHKTRWAGSGSGGDGGFSGGFDGGI